MHDEFVIGDRQFAVLIKDFDDRRVFLAYDITHLEQYEHQLSALIAIGIVLVGVALVFAGSWLGWRLSAPVRDLAERLGHFDPQARGERVDREYRDAEMTTITNAIDAYMQRLDGFIEREQEFASTASHELRTPVAVISGAIDVLKAIPDLPNKAFRSLARVESAVSNMQEMINAFLYLATESGSTKSHDEICQVDELISQIADDHSYLLENKDLKVNILSLEPCSIVAPPIIVIIVISNLIRNAIEHTACGAIEIGLASGILTVTNYSQHITPGEVAKIFQERVRKTENGNRGNGLGLNIIDRLCAHAHWQFNFSRDGNEMARARVDMTATLLPVYDGLKN